jgi:hemolysin activation/secretion protein
LPPVRAESEAGEGGEMLVRRLTAIHLLAAQGGDLREAARGLRVSDDLLLPSPRTLAARLRRWLDRPLHAGALAALVDEILIHYDGEGYPVVSVEVPQQDFSNGVLELRVEIGRYEEVGVSKPKYGDPGKIQKGLLLRPGELVRRAEIDEQTAWYGRTGFRKPRLFVSPGLEPVTADLLIGFEEAKPWLVTTGYENSGPDILGRDRFLLGVVGWTPGEHLLAWQSVVGMPASSLLANALRWEIPFHQRLLLDAAYAEVLSRYATAGIPVESEGSSWSFGAMHKIPLPSWGGWRQTFGAGFEIKGTDQFLLFGGGAFSPGEVVLAHGKLGHEVARTWENGGASFEASIYAAPGSLGGNNEDPSFKAYDPAADSSYVFGRLTGEGWWTPGADWQLRLRGGAQLADSRLLPAEQFAAGGYQTVRGTAEREFSADCGWNLSFEVLSPLISPGKGCDFRVLSFFDHAALDQRGGPESSLSGTGLGLRMRLVDHIDLRVDHGWRLDEAENRTHFGVNVSF